MEQVQAVPQATTEQPEGMQKKRDVLVEVAGGFLMAAVIVSLTSMWAVAIAGLSTL